MQVLTAKNPLTESFLVQLDVDLEGSGLDIPTSHSRWRFGHRPPVSSSSFSMFLSSSLDRPRIDQINKQGEYPVNTDAVKCSPLFELRESQGPALGLTPNGQSSPRVNEPQSGNARQSSSDYPSLYSTTDTSNSNSSAPIITQGIENTFHFSTASQSSPGGNSYNESSGSRPQSNHPTPSTSSIHNSSSHTSYTSPQNQSTSGGSVNGSSSNAPQARQTQNQPLGYIFPGSGSWQASVAMATGGGISGGGQQQHQMPNNNLMQPIMHMNGTGMSPGATTGMTPMSDLWPADSMTDSNDWMFGWPGQTPQP